MQDNKQDTTAINASDVQNPLPQSQEQGSPVTQDSQTGSPIDDMIARVDSYIKDPSLVTAQTLNDMKMELMDLKSFMDQEESAPGEPQGTEQNAPNGLAAAIGQYGGGQQ